MKKIYALLIIAVITTQFISAQIANNSFENWAIDTSRWDGFNFFPKDTFSFLDPVNWTSSNATTGADTFGGKMLVTQSAFAHTGLYAIRLTTDTLKTVGTPLGPRKITLPGMALNGKFTFAFPNNAFLVGGSVSASDFPAAGQPFTHWLADINGFYDYAPVFNDSTNSMDSCMISATLRRGTEIIATATFKSNNSTGGYTYFSAPFNYVSCSIPDTLVILISSSIPTLGSLLTGTTRLVIGSVLLAEDISYDTLPANFNFPPMANKDYDTTFINTPKTINVLANDYDCDGQALSVNILTNALHGTSSVTANQILYVPNSSFTGLDSVRYQASDANGNAIAWLKITVINSSTAISLSLGNNQTVCSGTAITLNPVVSGGTGVYTYSWSATGNSLSCNNCANPTATITQNSTYRVTVTDNSINSATAQVSYTIYPNCLSTCANGRYHDMIFSNVTISSNVTYSTSNGTTLKLDVYEPTGDTASQRPVIIFAHGGSFCAGSKTNDNVCTQLCTNYAKRGYVCASIDYRLASCLNMLDSAMALDEVAKAMSDAKASIRFFRKDAATTNAYRINPNLIYGAGNSAGSVIFDHIAYIDSLNECPAALRTVLNNNGGFDGNSGNAGYTSTIQAVINLAGGLNVPEFIGPGSIPSCNAQGDADATIPYNCANAQSGATPIRLCGLGAMEPLFTQYGISHVSIVYPGAGNAPWGSNTAELTQIDSTCANFLLTYTCGSVPVNSPSVTLGSNQTVCSGTAITLSPTVTGGTASYTYSWSATGNSLSCNNCANPTATITQNSTYRVTVTDANNATASASVSYSLGSGSLQVTANGPTTFCAGGSVVLNAGSGYTSYHWNTGASTSTIAVTTSGTYSVTAVSSNGCSFTGSQLVTVNTPASQSIIGNPSITPFQTYPYLVNATSGNTYTWTTTGGAIQSGQGTNSVTVIWGNTGPYLVTLVQTYSSGCSDTSLLVVANSGCSLAVNVLTTASSPLCTGDSSLLIAQVGSLSTYQWLRNGSPISGQTDDTLAVTSSGTYQVQVTSGSCTVVSNSSVFSFQSSPVTPVISSNVGSNSCSPQSVTLKVGTTYSAYLWNTGNTTDSIIVTTSGSYTVTVTGSNGCKSASLSYGLNLSIVAPNQICVVSVDSVTGKNLIIWEKPNTAGVDSYFVYKETNQFNIFNKAGALGVHDFSTFIDVNSNPQQQADRYKLAVLDTCGNINLQSNAHKTIHLTINSGLGGVWNLIWNHYEGFTFPSYNIYRGTASNGLQLLTTISSGNNSYTDVNPPSFVLYYQIEAVNPNGCIPTAKTDGFSSSLSNVVQVVGSSIPVTSTDMQVFLYPNPATSQLFIQSNEEIQQVSIYNTTGSLIMAVQLSTVNCQLPIENLPTGVYLAEIKTKQGSVKRRWVKM